MTCRECLEQFSSLSVDEIEAPGERSMREHLEACPQCRHEWQVFEHTLFVLSSSTQPLPAPRASVQMWEHCSEYIFRKVESERLNSSARFQNENEKQRGLLGWFTRQPKWSWATLGGAVAILGAVWFFTPQDEIRGNISAPPITIAEENDPGVLVRFQQPPAAASGLVNHHSAMAADPFTDNVGTTLVSYSATSPHR